jgi:hypothetical protein
MFASLLAVAFLAGCNTSTSPSATDPAASTPALSHYNADLTAAYSSLAAVRKALLGAGQAGLITKAKAQTIQTQCKIFEKTLDTLRQFGESDGNQSILTNTIDELYQLSLLVAAETVKQ